PSPPSQERPAGRGRERIIERVRAAAPRAADDDDRRGRSGRSAGRTAAAAAEPAPVEDDPPSAWDEPALVRERAARERRETFRQSMFDDERVAPDDAPAPAPAPAPVDDEPEMLSFRRRAMAHSQPEDPNGYGPNWSNVDDFDIPTVLRKQMD
ncbi:MAG: hypothetical protein AAF772_03575, partial [Acidobacteriota bacterium]